MRIDFTTKTAAAKQKILVDDFNYFVDLLKIVKDLPEFDEPKLSLETSKFLGEDQSQSFLARIEGFVGDRWHEIAQSVTSERLSINELLIKYLNAARNDIELKKEIYSGVVRSRTSTCELPKPEKKR